MEQAPAGQRSWPQAVGVKEESGQNSKTWGLSFSWSCVEPHKLNWMIVMGPFQLQIFYDNIFQSQYFNPFLQDNSRNQSTEKQLQVFFKIELYQRRQAEESSCTGSREGIHAEFPTFFHSPSFPSRPAQSSSFPPKAPLWHLGLGSSGVSTALAMRSPPAQIRPIPSACALSTSPCQLCAVFCSSCFPASSSLSLIPVEAFVISEPNYHNADFKLQLEIAFRGQKGQTISLLKQNSGLPTEGQQQGTGTCLDQ